MSTNKNEIIDKASIPDELCSLPQWICWKFEKRNGKATKVPKNPRSGSNARVNDPRTWTDFQTAWECYESGPYEGIGFVFTRKGPYCGIDLDKCRDPNTSKVEQWAISIIKCMNTYSEISPSGNGIHLIAKARKPKGRNRKGNFEVYDEGRWFTFTGNLYNGSPPKIEERQNEIEEICKELFGFDEEIKTIDKPILTASDASGDDL